jgi:hypothetical protein
VDVTPNAADVGERDTRYASVTHGLMSLDIACPKRVIGVVAPDIMRTSVMRAPIGEDMTWMTKAKNGLTRV